MTGITEIIDALEDLIRNDTQNFFYEVRMGQPCTAEEFTDFVRRARGTNDARAEARNRVERAMKEALVLTGRDCPAEKGEVAESFGFLLDVFTINHVKVWFLEEEIRTLNVLERPDAERMRTLVNASRDANNNRIRIRALLERKMNGLLAGTEPAGEQDPKFFRAEARK